MCRHGFTGSTKQKTFSVIPGSDQPKAGLFKCIVVFHSRTVLFTASLLNAQARIAWNCGALAFSQRVVLTAEPCRVTTMDVLILSEVRFLRS